MRRHPLAWLCTVLTALSVLMVGSPEAPAVAAAQTSKPLPVATTKNHFVSNLNDDVTGPRSVGFTIYDTGDSLSEINALPRGVRAMVWLGQKCPKPADAVFRATVRKLAKNPKVFGYYLADEPHVADCPGGPKALATRAQYIRVASRSIQKSFIVLSRVEDYRAFRPAVSRVSLIGLDPYPCSIANPTCRIGKIDEKVKAALASFPRQHIVPVYQAFGQSGTDDHYYNLPTPKQMEAMISRWAAFVPRPIMDYTYGWGNQGSSKPTLVDSSELQAVFRSYFAG